MTHPATGGEHHAADVNTPAGGPMHLAEPRSVASGGRQPMEGLRLMIEFVFYAFPIRKLYAEVLEPNLEQFGRGFPRLLEEEGRLKEHAFVGGTYVDQVILSLTRSRWFDDPRGHAGTGVPQLRGLVGVCDGRGLLCLLGSDPVRARDTPIRVGIRFVGCA